MIWIDVRGTLRFRRITWMHTNRSFSENTQSYAIRLHMYIMYRIKNVCGFDISLLFWVNGNVKQLKNNDTELNFENEFQSTLTNLRNVGTIDLRADWL